MMTNKDLLLQKFSKMIDQTTDKDLPLINTIVDSLERQQNGTNRSYIEAFMNVEEQLEDDTVTISIPITPLLYNPLGIVHGGMIATLIDTAMGTLSNKATPIDKMAVTTQLNIHYLAAIKGNNLTCYATITHKGSRMMVLSAVVERDDGKKVAIASSNFFVVGR